MIWMQVIRCILIISPFVIKSPTQSLGDLLFLLRFLLLFLFLLFGQVHALRKERIIIIIIIIIIKIKIIIRNGAKTISPPNFVWET
jgi:uncharacterized membrane protein YfhO